MKAGVDEAGKGCVIGPLVVAGVACNCEERLGEIGVKDSKRLSHRRREELAAEIRKMGKVEVIKVQPEKLDEMMRYKTINEILRECYASIIRKLSPEVAYVDSPDVIPERLSRELEKMTSVKVVAEHKADEKYPLVAAASIIAKVEREKEIEELKEKLGDFGSGYASDPRTREVLRGWITKGKLPSCVRRRWKTISNLKQQTLEDF
ncbi:MULTISPECIES: ribonuclease HII [unclassified Archaeoglobus]|jgi:ribonuclease HII|uniref:ribonuclease HII n=1 Tax=unclassified Archaeoglobus TaxID=2643606 RepID=UPI0025B94429|nr:MULTISPECIES: ribonuclease HII [unclassified Archaeoglobus]